MRDDGIGLRESAAAGDGVGIRIMHYRAGLIGASLTIESKEGEGTIVICRFGAGTPARSIGPSS